jgi:hypothetical protein
MEQTSRDSNQTPLLLEANGSDLFLQESTVGEVTTRVFYQFATELTLSQTSQHLA